MKTYTAKPGSVRGDWYVIDGTNVVLGRLAAKVAFRLRGKHKPQFTPHVDTGDFIVVVNADKIRVTGDKAKQKLYFRHTGYVGGIFETAFEKLQAKHPDRVVKMAVKGMLPKGRLGYAQLKKLKVYSGPAHPHEAQQPQPLQV
jgi:large subunit ribosomal protein L13